MRRRTMVLSRDPSSGVVRQGSKEKFIGKSADSWTNFFCIRSRLEMGSQIDGELDRVSRCRDALVQD
jgi:hypothetical protein